MLNRIPIAVLVILGLISLAIAGWVLRELVAAEDQAEISDQQLWLLQIKWTAASAYLGFFVATLIKFCFDLVLEDQRGKRARRTLAKELLAELSYVSDEVPRFFTQVRYLKDASPYLDVDHAGLRKSIDHFVATLPAPHTPVYDASIGKLGLLGSSTAASAVHVFAGVRGIHNVKSAMQVGSFTKSTDAYESLLEFSTRYEATLMPDITDLLQKLTEIAGVDD